MAILGQHYSNMADQESRVGQCKFDLIKMPTAWRTADSNLICCVQTIDYCWTVFLVVTDDSPDLSPNMPSSSSNNTVVAVIAVLVVLMLVGIAILVVGCVFIYRKKGMAVYKSSSVYSRGESSLQRSVSRSSCGSERSHASDRSHSSRHSSRSSRSR